MVKLQNLLLLLLTVAFCIQADESIRPHFITRGPVIPSFHQAALRGDIPLMQVAIRKGQDVNEVDNQGNTAIFYAILSGSLPAVKFLMFYRPDLQIKNRGVQDERVATDVDRGVPTTIPVRGVGQFYSNPHNLPAIYIALRRGNLDIVKYIVERGALDGYGINDLAGLLVPAAASRNLDVMRYLITLPIFKGRMNNKYIYIVEAMLDMGATTQQIKNLIEKEAFGFIKDNPERSREYMELT